RGLLRALAAGEPRRLADAMAREVALGALAGRMPPKRAAELGATAEAMAAQSNQPLARALVNMAAGGRALYDGQWKQSQELLELTQRLMRDHCVGATHELNLVKMLLIAVLYSRGEVGLLRSCLSEWLREAAARGELFGSVGFRIGFTMITRL